jgi:hypothetical protein
MSLLKKHKVSMLRGANPFTALLVQRERTSEQVPLCDEEWTSGLRDFSTPCNHKCSRVYGHRANHVCNCGATRHTVRVPKGPRTRLGRAG